MVCNLGGGCLNHIRKTTSSMSFVESRGVASHDEETNYSGHDEIYLRLGPLERLTRSPFSRLRSGTQQ